GFLIEITERTAIAPTPDGIVAQAQGMALVRLSGAEPTSMNFWGFTVDLFPHLERLFEEFLEEHGEDQKAEFYLPAAVSSLISSGEATVRLINSSDPWFGLTYPEDRPLVVEALAAIAAKGA
ncbi:MAG: nucleotidyltransferase, partial [bacterium]